MSRDPGFRRDDKIFGYVPVTSGMHPTPDVSLRLNNRHHVRTFCDALHFVLRKGSELGADVPEAAYVGLTLLREFERRRDMADEYAGCH